MGTRFYFHTDNDELDFDNEGTELRDLEQARHEALVMWGDVLAQANGTSLWNGKPWKVWASDGPNGTGRVLFTLQLSAS
jgi:hypothetical protein